MMRGIVEGIRLVRTRTRKGGDNRKPIVVEVEHGGNTSSSSSSLDRR
jgi:hypothetical protein